MEFSQALPIQISVQPTFGSSNIVLTDSSFQFEGGHLQIDELRFYLSHFRFYKKGKWVLTEPNSYHLVDARIVKSREIRIENEKNLDFDEMKFNLGIDSATNVSGAMGGDLDPTKGMYWTWQSGYINLKLQGKSDLCKTRNREFQFHLGGYLGSDNALQERSFAVNSEKEIKILFDSEIFLGKVDLTHQNHVMSPKKAAVILSHDAAQAFFLFEK